MLVVLAAVLTVIVARRGGGQEQREELLPPSQLSQPEQPQTSPRGGLKIEEAMLIAQDSECAEKANLTSKAFYNESSKTWWIDLDMKEEFKKDICNPACVVSEESETAEINWRCTGLIPQ